MNPSFDRHRGRWALCILVMLALVAGLGLRSPSPPDEPRFVLAAHAMVESGQWLIPHRGLEIYAEKPPVFMWMQAVSYTVVRNWQVAFLLPSLLAALATLALTWDLARRLWSREAAWHAVAALWVCLQFGLQAKRGQIDMVLVALTTLSLWALVRYLLLQRSRSLLWLGAFAAGVGTVTKGVGFLPLLVLIPWLAVRHARPADTAPPHSGLPWLEGTIAFLAGLAVWLGPLLATLAFTPDPALSAYTRELLFKQTGTRYANAWHHVQPWWYYLKVVATLWLPGSLLLPWLVPAWTKRIRGGDRGLVLLLGWSAIVLLFFTFSPGKREVYIFPVLPALCVAAAPLLAEVMVKRGVRRVLAGYLVALSGLALVAALAAMFEWSDWASALAQQREISAPALHLLLAWLLFLGIAGGLLLGASLTRHVRIGTAVVLFTSVLWIAYGIGFAPAIDGSSSARQIMQRAGHRIGPDAELGLVAWREQHLLQVDRPAVEFGFTQPWHVQWQQARAWIQGDPAHRWLFVLEEALGPCVVREKGFEIGKSNRRTWWLVPGTAVRPDCVTPPFANDEGDT